jgi:methionyl-tRNA formyltransferase
MRIIFMGTPDFAVPALKKLIGSEHEVIAVYTQPSRPSGRGQHAQLSVINQLAQEFNIPVETPISLRKIEAQQQFNSYNADLAIVAAYGLILPQEVLDSPKYGCINIHPSDLPRWRGAAPIQRTILAGDMHTAMCIMQMDAGLDTGDILLKQQVKLDLNYTSGQLHDEMAALGGELVLQVINNLQDYPPIKQSEHDITYANKLSKNEAEINWVNDANTIYNHIRGMSPWPVAYFIYKGEKIKIYSCEIIEQQGMPGTVIDDKLTIACGNNSIRPLKIQRAGRNVITTQELLRGYKIPQGTDLNAKL